MIQASQEYIIFRKLEGDQHGTPPIKNHENHEIRTGPGSFREAWKRERDQEPHHGRTNPEATTICLLQTRSHPDPVINQVTCHGKSQKLGPSGKGTCSYITTGDVKKPQYLLLLYWQKLMEQWWGKGEYHLISKTGSNELWSISRAH